MNNKDINEDLKKEYNISPEEEADLKARYKSKKDMYRVMNGKMVSNDPQRLFCVNSEFCYLRTTTAQSTSCTKSWRARRVSSSSTTA